MTSAQEQAAHTYNTAADYFDHPALGFWDRVGRRTSRLGAGRHHGRTGTANVMDAPFSIRLEWCIVVAQRVIFLRLGLSGGGGDQDGAYQNVS